MVNTLSPPPHTINKNKKDILTLPKSRNGPQAVHVSQPPLEESPYLASLNQGLTPSRPDPSSVRYFSDYSRVFYHPRSVVQLAEHELHSTVQPFERHATGEALFADLDREHDLLDRDLRPFVEEADCMQGVQVFAGMEDAWGGFAGRYLERVRDEYGKVGVWVWGLQEGNGGMGGLGRVSLSFLSFLFPLPYFHFFHFFFSSFLGEVEKRGEDRRGQRERERIGLRVLTIG